MAEFANSTAALKKRICHARKVRITLNNAQLRAAQIHLGPGHAPGKSEQALGNRPWLSILAKPHGAQQPPEPETTAGEKTGISPAPLRDQSHQGLHLLPRVVPGGVNPKTARPRHHALTEGHKSCIIIHVHILSLTSEYNTSESVS